MTSPGGGGNDINLAALWVPVMPETSQLGAEMRKAGEKAKGEFAQGFNSGGSSSPEAMGTEFGNKMRDAVGKAFMKAELPLGLSSLMENASKEIDEKMSSKLTGSLSSAIKEYTANYNALTAAQARAADAEQKINLARDNGFNKASIMIPLLTQQKQAQNELSEATEKTAASHEKMATAQGHVEEFNKQNSASGNILAGVMGGAVAAGIGIVTAGFEKIIELGVEVFESAIEGAHELADQLIEIGEKYESLEHQVELYSGAQGEALEALNASAAKVFGTLDVAGDKVGQTMAVLGSRLDMEAGPALEKLTHDVTELQGRFGALDVGALSAIMVNFKVPADQVDDTLASLVQSGRSAGISIGDMVTALDTASPLLAEAGLNAEQAGAFIADMTDHGLNARQMMTGLGTAQATFSKNNLDFKDGMKQASDEIQHYVDIGDSVDADALAQKLFGSRNWASALQMIKSYNEVVDAQPGKYAASADSLQELFDSTQTLANKWEEIKHQIEDALAPIGLAAVTQIGKGFDWLTTAFERNREQLVTKIKTVGDTFIGMLPEIQALGVETIQIFGAMGEAVLKFVGFMASSVGTTGHLAGDVLSLIPGMGDKANDLIKASDAMYDIGQKAMSIKFSDDMNNIADWVKGLNTDVPGLTTQWDNLTMSMRGTPTVGGGGAGIGGQGFAFNPDFSPSPGSANITPGPGGAPGAPGGTAGGGASGAPAAGAGKHVADWDAIAQKESGGQWNTTFNTGVPLGGGLQIKPDTWYEFGGLAFSQYAYQASKDQQIQIANRILNGWGSVAGQGPSAWDNGRTYVGSKDGSTVSSGDPMLSAMAPNAYDTVPIWVQPGEEIINAEQSAKHRALLKFINAGAFQPGGTAGTNGSAAYAASGAGNDLQGVDPQLQFITQIANGFGLTLTAGQSGHGTHGKDGGWHDSGQAGDFSNGVNTPQELAFAQYMFTHFGSELAELIHTSPGMPQLIKDGVAVDPQSVYGPWLSGHHDHVHVAIKSTQPLTDLMSPGSEPLATGAGFTAGSFSPGSGSSKNGYAGMTNQYGGLGAYGGQTADQAYQTATAVQNAKDTAADQDYRITQKTSEITTLQKAYDDLKAGDKGGLLGDPDIQKKLDAAAKQVTDATHDLAVLQRERAEQTGVISNAERKQQESAMQAPDKQKTTKATGSQEFEELGGGLLKGLASDFGLGSVFGKSPMDWGIVKLLGGMANWGIGTANAWADEVGKGHTGMTGGQPIPGWDSGGGGGGGGFTSLLGGMMPSIAQAGQGFPNVSAGPNIAVDPKGAVHGAGQGQPPGPVIGGDFQPVSVTNNGPRQSDYDTWKYAQNSRTEGAMSGLPGGG